MMSLRRTILTRIIILIAAIGLCAAIASFALVTRAMNRFLDDQLQETAINVQTGKQNGAIAVFEEADEDDLLVRVWDRTGMLVHRSGPSLDIPWQSSLGLSNTTAGGQDWRIFRVTDDANNNIQIAQRWSARRNIAMGAAGGAALPVLIGIPIAWLLLAWPINRTLQGLRLLSDEIERRSVDAHEPLSSAQVPDEVVPLVTAIEKLVERHQRALESQRRFVADAAHELRTPLAALQIQSDNLSAADLGLQARDLVDELGAGVRRASRLVNQLLEMARTEAASVRIRKTVELRELITSVVSDFIALADVQNLELAIEADRPVSVENDPDAVRKIVSVLMENAIRYSPSGGLIVVRLLTSEGKARIEVEDAGPGISDEAMPFIYAPFFRASSQDLEGTGLGLAIAETAADRNGARLTHRNHPDRSGLVATVEFALNDLNSLNVTVTG